MGFSWFDALPGLGAEGLPWVMPLSEKFDRGQSLSVDLNRFDRWLWLSINAWGAGEAVDLWSCCSDDSYHHLLDLEEFVLVC